MIEIPIDPAREEPADTIVAYVFREHLSLFGANAPPYDSFQGLYVPQDTWEAPDDGRAWSAWLAYPNLPPAADGTPGDPRCNYDVFHCDIALERTVSKITCKSWVVLELPSGVYRPFKIDRAFDRSFTGFTIAGRGTGLLLRLSTQNDTHAPLTHTPSTRALGDASDRLHDFDIRSTTVHVASELLRRTALPDPTLVTNPNFILLDTVIDGLTPQQKLVLRGQDAATGEEISELTAVASVTRTSSRTGIYFATPLRRTYALASVTLHANTVDVRHGETLREVLGSGDAGLAAQRFTLRRGPLSRCGDEVPLEVLVDGAPWARSASALGARHDDATFTLRHDLDGRPEVVFGDGERGRRLPTGSENVTAVWRAGAGAAGNLPARSLTLLRTQPRGVRAVEQPVGASGGADGDAIDVLREAVPRRAALLERVVSLRDHEAWALHQPGVGKARARSLWNGERSLVHLTVADSDGAPLPAGVVSGLRAALQRVRDGQGDLDLQPCARRSFRVAAAVRVAPTRAWPAVHAALVRALRDAFSPRRRAVAQRVTAVEVLAAMHGVEGVLAVRLTGLHLLAPPDGAASPLTSGVHDVLPALEARRVVRAGALLVEPAQLLALASDADITLELAPQETRR